MDLRQLEMLRAVAENSSFTLAGRELHVAQSAVSRKIRMLEEELGEKLFKRINKRIFVTPAGRIMLRYTAQVFQDLRNASLEVADLAGMNQGLIRIGSGMTACMYLLPPVIEKFQAKFPKVDIQVQTGSADLILARVRENSLDLGVVTQPVHSPDLELIPCGEEEMVVVVSPRHRRLARRRFIRPEELAGLRMILFARGAATRTLIDDYFARIGVQPGALVESENVATIKPLVRLNLGISILPLASVAAESRRGELVYLHLRGDVLSRRIGVVVQKSSYRSKPLLDLIALFRSANDA